MSLNPEERDKRLHSLDETMGQNLDQQIKEHKASAKVALTLHFNRELVAAEECAKKGIYKSFCPSHLGGNAKYNVKSAGEVKEYFLFREPIQ